MNVLVAEDLTQAWVDAEKAIDFPQNDPRWRYGTWMLRLAGPWDIEYNGHRPTYQAWADPYNATGDGFDKSIEGLGPTPAAALRDLIQKLESTSVSV